MSTDWGHVWCRLDPYRDTDFILGNLYHSTLYHQQCFSKHQRTEGIERIKPITYRGEGLFGPDHQIIYHNSKTAKSSTS